MPPPGECSRCIGPVDAMVIVVVIVTKTQHKTQLLASIYRTFLLVKVVIFVTQKGPPTHVIDATSAVQM
jgi:hypothetical protein